MQEDGRPEDPLFEAAPLARKLASTLCVRPEAGIDCSWYHGFRIYMRAFGMGSARDLGFITPVLRQLARGGEWPRVLISGAIDYVIPSHAMWAYELEKAPIDLTVMDICETPLALARWYADRRKTSIDTDRSDIFTYDPGKSFDVIVTSSFFGPIPPARRQELFDVWAKLLRPGGKVVFANRVRWESEDEIRFTPDEVTAFGETARAAAAKLDASWGLDLDEVASWGRAYAQGLLRFPVRSTNEIEGWLKNAGFRADDFDVKRHNAEAGLTITGPTLNDSADYANVVATRV